MTTLDRAPQPRTFRLPFTALNIRRILDGPKRMTRRVATPQPFIDEDGNLCVEGAVTTFVLGRNSRNEPNWQGYFEVFARAPAVGDQIAVTEPYYQRGHYERLAGVATKGGRVKRRFVAADDAILFQQPDGYHSPSQREARKHGELTWYYRHGRYMPTRYSRLLLRVTARKAERLQDITEADALLEGIYAETWGNVRDQLADPQERDRYPFDLPVFIPPIEAEETVPICLTAVEAFQHLWTSLYGDDPVKGWAANPTVIATSFEPVT